MSEKDTNPKDAVGTRKAPVSVLPWPVMYEIGLGLLEGARKYGRHNYRAVGVRASVYFDAAIRHLTAWWEGEDVDPDSGMNHISKCLACLTVFRDAQLNDKWTDDRPPSCRPGWMEAMNDVAGEIIDKYPDAVEPHVQSDISIQNVPCWWTDPADPPPAFGTNWWLQKQKELQNAQAERVATQQREAEKAGEGSEGDPPSDDPGAGAVHDLCSLPPFTAAWYTT